MRLLQIFIMALCMGNFAGAKEFTIVTSFYPMYVETLNVTRGIDGVRVVNMTGANTGCLHDYQLTPENLKTLEKANVFVMNGGGMEGFMEDVVKRFPNLKILNASEGWQWMEAEDHEEEHHEEEHHEEEHHEDHEHCGHHHHHGGMNPHVWVSVEGSMYQVRNISEGLGKLDPQHAEIYKKNGEAYLGKLKTLKEKMHKELENIQYRNVITFHPAFDYFAKEFELNVVGEVRGNPSAKGLAELVRLVKEKNVKGLFSEPQYESTNAEVVGRETGLKVRELDPVVTGSMENPYDVYLNAMDKNLEILKDALK